MIYNIPTRHRKIREVSQVKFTVPKYMYIEFQEALNLSGLPACQIVESMVRHCLIDAGLLSRGKNRSNL